MSIEIYGKNGCSACTRAKNILNSVGIEYTSYTLDEDFTRSELLSKFPNAMSFPVVVVNGSFVGSYNEFEQQVLEQRENFGKILISE
jgi:glutaredoxin